MEELMSLDGDDLDLKLLARSFPTGSARVEKRDEHYLLILEGEAQREDAAVVADGTKVLAQMVAIMLKDGPNFRPPRIRGITKKNADGSLIHCVSLAGSALLRMDNSGTLTVSGPDGEVVESKGPTEDQIALELARNNESLRWALVIYGSLEHNWVNLYKVLDAMRDGNGGLSGLKAKKFVPAEDIDNFEATANSYKAIGLESRHASEQGIPEARMTLEEAQEMFRKLFDGWIQEVKDGTLPSYDCFISYSRRDGRAYAIALAESLHAHGFSCFFDLQDIATGEIIAAASRKALLESRTLIFIASPSALTSNWVRLELDIFRSTLSRRTGKRIIVPIVFDPLDLMAVEHLFWLSDIQWLEEEPSELGRGPSDKGIRRIVKALAYDRSPHSIQPRESIDQSVEEKRPLNEGKLIIVGRGEVGKTSLIKRLVHNEFLGDESKTQGINITKWSMACGTDKVRLNIWDFGGQEIMHATHQFFLTERSLYLLVLNGRGGGEDEDAEYWLKHIESFGGDSPIIVVQNKISQHSFDLNYRGLRGRYPQIRAFVKTDCQDAVGFDGLYHQIQKALGEMPEVRMPFPLEWFNVKRLLEDMKEDFMGFELFQKLCRAEGIAEDSDREMLSSVLHCLGIALNYCDDLRLRETSVLKPEWVTQGIYKILNAQELAEHQGEMHLNDLGRILPKNRYPAGKHIFLLELMRKFSLCFPFADEPDRFLIPELLGKEEPKEAVEFRPIECLNFEYHYAVLPEGLIPRFIVRSHTLSRDQERWRFGAILIHEDCKALVKAVPGDRRVIIRVKGGDSGSRRRLLAIIRYDFDRINGEFKDRLEVNPKVPLTNYPEFSIDYKKLVAFEKQGITKFPEFVREGVVTFQVNELLNGVDFDSQRDESLEAILQARKLFYSYSHKDESLRDELEIHLKLLQRQGAISTWHDRKILPSTEWDGEIDRRLETANIILLLVSADFIASNYIWEKEVRRAMERHEKGEAIVTPVVLRFCDWEGAPFAKLQALPTNAKPVTSWEDRDAAWTDVVKGIRAVTETNK